MLLPSWFSQCNFINLSDVVAVAVAVAVVVVVIVAEEFGIRMVGGNKYQENPAGMWVLYSYCGSLATNFFTTVSKSI